MKIQSYTSYIWCSSGIARETLLRTSGDMAWSWGIPPICGGHKCVRNRLRRIDLEKPAVVPHTATPLESHSSSRDDAVTYWEIASVRPSVEVTADRCGDVASACPEDMTFETCGASALHDPIARHPCQTSQVLAPCRSGALGRNIDQTSCLP